MSETVDDLAQEARTTARVAEALARAESWLIEATEILAEGRVVQPATLAACVIDLGTEVVSVAAWKLAHPQ